MNSSVESLAEIVIAEGLISADDLKIAANVSEQTRRPLVVTLVQECAVDDLDIVFALKKHIRIECPDPAKVEYDSDALRVLSLHDCRRLAALPLSIEIHGSGPKLLRVAMADPTDTVGVAELDHLSGCDVSVVLMTLGAVEEMIESAYKQFVTEVVSRSSISRGHGVKTGVDSDPTKETKAIKARPRTVPFRRVTEDASMELRIEALLSLGIDKGLFNREEYDALLRSLMKKKLASGE